MNLNKKLTTLQKFQTHDGRYKIVKDFFRETPIDLTSMLDLEGSVFSASMEIISYFRGYGSYENEYGEKVSLIKAFEEFIENNYPEEI